MFPTYNVDPHPRNSEEVDMRPPLTGFMLLSCPVHTSRPHPLTLYRLSFGFSPMRFWANAWCTSTVLARLGLFYCKLHLSLGHVHAHRFHFSVESAIPKFSATRLLKQIPGNAGKCILVGRLRIRSSYCSYAAPGPLLCSSPPVLVCRET